jgi:NAD(P)-dependent dehydrogenase (short-subunit alcohol dehydrogenase family)
MGDLDGQRAIVTGGGTGIGFGIAKTLLDHGATVTLAARRLDVLEKAAGTLASEYGRVRVRTAECDITQDAQVTEAMLIAAEGGGLDIAVANAGGSGTGGTAPFLTLKGADWLDVCNINIVGTANTIREAALLMRDNGGGAIIATSSAGSAGAEPCFSHYSTSKAAVDMLIINAAVELGDFGIRVNAIQPGVVPSEMADVWEGLDSQFAHILKNTPLGRIGKPEEIGDAVAFLASPRASWITGQILGVDGGLSVPMVANLQGVARKLHGDEMVDSNLGGDRLGAF